MTERPILFSAPMVRAILAGTKTQTRRVIVSNKKAAPSFVVYADPDGSYPVYSRDGELGHYIDAHGYEVEERMQCPYGQPGDQLWVRETWSGCWGPLIVERPCGKLVIDAAVKQAGGEISYATDANPLQVFYRSDNAERVLPHMKWRPAIHMPRWASRIQLEVTGVRVERLQDISEADCIAEGCITAESAAFIRANRNPMCPPDAIGTDGRVYESARACYCALWESINGPGSWDANPWVWVVEFRRLKP